MEKTVKQSPQSQGEITNTMYKSIGLLLIMLLLVVACNTKSNSNQLERMTHSNPNAEPVEISLKEGEVLNKSIPLPSATKTLIATESEDIASPPVISPAEVSSESIVDFISVSSAEDVMTTVEAVRELGPVSYTHLTLPTKA